MLSNKYYLPFCLLGRRGFCLFSKKGDSMFKNWSNFFNDVVTFQPIKHIPTFFLPHSSSSPSPPLCLLVPAPVKMEERKYWEVGHYGMEVMQAETMFLIQDAFHYSFIFTSHICTRHTKFRKVQQS